VQIENYLTYDTYEYKQATTRTFFNHQRNLEKPRETHHPSPLTAGIKYEYEYL
jgi:hypothetical protein